MHRFENSDFRAIVKGESRTSTRLTLKNFNHVNLVQHDFLKTSTVFASEYKNINPADTNLQKVSSKILKIPKTKINKISIKKISSYLIQPPFNSIENQRFKNCYLFVTPQLNSHKPHQLNRRIIQPLKAEENH